MHYESSYLTILGITFSILLLATAVIQLLQAFRPNLDLTEVKQRTRSWWVIAGIFAVATLTATTAYWAIGLLSFVAFRELYSLVGFRPADRHAIGLAILAIPLQLYLAYIGWYGAFIIFIPVVLFLLLPLVLILRGETTGITTSMASIQWTFMLTVFGLSHLAYLLTLPGAGPQVQSEVGDGRELLFFLILLTELNDVFQFIWGKVWGNRKIVPRVSPNKTWAGFLGGIICTTVIGGLLNFLTPLSLPLTLLISAALAVAGFTGDLVVSAIKRDVGVKDTGTAIPGHGGLLDRVDSLAYTAPVFFHLLYYIAY